MKALWILAAMLLANPAFAKYSFGPTPYDAPTAPWKSTDQKMYTVTLTAYLFDDQEAGMPGVRFDLGYDPVPSRTIESLDPKFFQAVGNYVSAYHASPADEVNKAAAEKKLETMSLRWWLDRIRSAPERIEAKHKERKKDREKRKKKHHGNGHLTPLPPDDELLPTVQPLPVPSDLQPAKPHEPTPAIPPPAAA
jgi:hypothetical protein